MFLQILSTIYLGFSTSATEYQKPQSSHTSSQKLYFISRLGEKNAFKILNIYGML